MAIVVHRQNGSIIEMPEGPARFHAELRRTGSAQAVERHTGKSFEVQAAEDGDLHFTERSSDQVKDHPPVLIRQPKLPINK